MANLKATRTLVNTAREFPGMEDLVAQMDRLPIWGESDQARLDPNTIEQVVETTRVIVSRLKIIDKFMSGMGVPDANDDQVIVRLPTTDLGQLSEDTTLLTKALEQVIVNSKVNGQMAVAHVEHGSIAIILTVGVSAVAVIGSLAWAAAVVFKKIQEGRILEQNVAALKIKNDSLQDVAEAQKKLLKELIEMESRHLDREVFGELEDPERVERIKYSIDSLAKLIERGAEICPALTAPESVKNLFPNFGKLGLIESKVKQITEHSGGKNPPSVT